LRALYEIEVRKIFGHCDSDGDGVYRSQELGCLVQVASQKWLDSLKEPQFRTQFRSLVPFMSLEQLETALRSEDFSTWFVYLIKGIFLPSLGADEVSILEAFESVIRRSCPLGFWVQEGKC